MSKFNLLLCVVMYIAVLAGLWLVPWRFYTEFRNNLTYVEEGITPGVGKVITGKHASIGSSDSADDIVKDKIVDYAPFQRQSQFKDYALLKMENGRLQMVQRASSYTWRPTGREALDLADLKKDFPGVDFKQMEQWANPSFFNHRQGYMRIGLAALATIVLLYLLITGGKKDKKETLTQT